MGVSNRLSTFDYVISSPNELELHAKIIWTSLVAQMVKNLLGMWKNQIKFLGQKDPLEKEMATHCSILAWRIPWTEEPGLQSMESQRVGHN